MPKADGTKRKVKLQYMATEPGDAAPDTKSLLEGWYYSTDEPLLDGPVCRRVAVIDLDPETGAVLPGAVFRAPSEGKKIGRYRVADEMNFEARDFQQSSVFGAVMKMIDMFEEDDVLGRQLIWAFKGEQLLVVPRAGIMKNAFYHRDSRSLQFFYFEDPRKPKKFIYTCLSPDIVAHETAHAILDGIAPDLYDATSPQALAIHEAVADLGAVIFAVRSRRLREQVLDLTGGDLKKSNAFNRIAQQFGEAVHGASHPLRDLSNERTLEKVGREPHDLSEVLTGALYAVMVRLHDERKSELAAETGQSDFSISGEALNSAAQRLKRLAFRGLDYLPPGEVSFADYGRAIVAADTSSNPGDRDLREIAKEEFVRRGIVARADELDPVSPDFTLPTDLDLDLLVSSDWAAYQFVERFRAELLVPPNISFEVRPRLDVTKKTFQHGEVEARTRELLLKIAWRENRVIDEGGLFREISLTYGTTLAINWHSRSICGLVSTSPRAPSRRDRSAQVNDDMRRAYLAACFAEGSLSIDAPNVQIQNGTLRVRSMGQMLHMTVEV